MLKLFHSPGSCSMASLICLNEAKAEFECITVDFSSAEQTKPEYLSLNPKGRVPVLVTEKGKLTETPAILVYIAQRFADAGLAPVDNAFDLAQAQSFNSYLCSTIHVNHAHGGRASRWADEKSSHEDMARKVPETVGAAFDLIENNYLKGPWVLGDNYSICDAYLYTVTSWLPRDGVSPDRHPRVQEHFRRMSERPAVQASTPD